jgi:hypothetical protein
VSGRRLLGGPARRWLVVAVVAGLVWRVARYAVVFPMWGDEAFVAVNVLLRDLGGMTRPLEHGVVAPVGFLWTEVLARSVLGPGEAALRLVPFLAGIASLLLFARLARERLSPATAAVATALLAASYYPVRHAAEVKPYALDLLLAVPVIGLAWRILEDGPTARRWGALCAVAAVGAWFSWTTAFVAGGAWLALAAVGPRRGGGAPARVAWLATGLVVAASFAAHYALVGHGQQWSVETTESSGQWSEHFPPLSEPWRLPLWLLRELSGNMLAYPNGGREYGAAGTLLLATVGGAALWRRGRRRAVLLLVAPLAPMLVAAALRKYPFGGSARTTLHLAVPACVLAGTGLAAALARLVRGRRAVLAARIVVVALALVALGGAVADAAFPRKKAADAACRDAVARLDRESAPTDAWILAGDFVPNPRVPDLSAWGGSAARLRYQLLRRRGERPLLLGPPVAGPRPAVGGLWLLAYRDDEEPVPDSVDAYVRAWSARDDVAEDASRSLLLDLGGAERLVARRLVPR